MRPNQLIVSKTKNKLEWLIVDICEKEGLVSVSDFLKTPPTRPSLVSIQEVESEVQKGRWEIKDHEFPAYLFQPDSELKDKWLAKRDEAVETIRPIIEDPELQYEYLFGEAGCILRMLTKQSGHSKKYVAAQLNRFFRFGGMKNALLPHYVNCGQNYRLPPEPKFLEDGSACLASKSGPETKYGNPYRGVTQLDVENIKRFSTKVPSGTEVVLKDLYRDFCLEYCSHELNTLGNEAGEYVKPLKVIYPRRRLISPRSFQRQLNRVISKLTWLKKRKGDIGYERDHKGKPGLAREGLHGATSRYEIDSTVADVYIRYPYTKDELLSTGRPIIYFVIDTYSSMIVGVHVCFEGPNWHGASQALYNAFTDKVAFCERYGLEIDEADWPCHHVCSQLTLDLGGENTDNHIEGILKGRIGVKIANFTAYHRGDCKGTVEKKFDIVQKKAIHFEAGKVEKVPCKEDQHASKRSLYTYEEFMYLLLKHIIHTNKNMLLEGEPNFEMARDNLKCTPLNVWNWSLAESIERPSVSKAKLRFALLPEAEATVRGRGVYFKGLYYSCNEIVKRQWLDRAKNEGRFKVRIRYTDLSTNRIWWWDHEAERLITLELTDRSAAYANQRWADVMHRLEIYKHYFALYSEEAFSEDLLMEMDLRDFDEQVKKSSRHLKPSNSKSIQPGMRENKAVEAAAQRHRELQDINDDLSSQQVNHKPVPEESQPSDQDLSDPTVIPF